MVEVETHQYRAGMGYRTRCLAFLTRRIHRWLASRSIRHTLASGGIEAADEALFR